MSFQTSALIVTWAALLLLALVVSGLVRQVHQLSSGGARRTDRLGPRPGSPAPGLAGLGVRAPAVLLFLSEDCHTCAGVLEEAGRLGFAGQVVGLYGGAGPTPPRGSGGAGQGGQAGVFGRYGGVGTPFAVIVGRDGRIERSEPIGSPAALRALLNRLEDQVGGRP